MDVLDKKRCKVMTCTFKEIRSIMEHYHYKKASMWWWISMCFAMFIDDKLVWWSVLWKPRHEKKYKDCIDIRRMALLDSAPKNSESYFLGQIIKRIASNTKYKNVLSYSDLTAWHEWTIYKASNFKMVWETSPTKNVVFEWRTYHPRSITIDRPYSYRIREWLKTWEAVIVTGLPKIIWMYEIKNNNCRKVFYDYVDTSKYKK